jgi:multidrug transporter EmrE-like cation transporter
MLPELSKYIFFGLIVVAVAFEVVADILFKRWATENRYLLLAIGLLLYFTGTVFWAISLKYKYLSKAVTMFTVLNLVAVVLAGVVMFNEQLTLLHKIGIGLGILSVVLMEI